MTRQIGLSVVRATLAATLLCSTFTVYAQSAADCRAYAERYKNSQPLLGGAARGAAGGALFGAIAGNAGKGAGIGALIGGIGRGVRRNNESNQVFDDCMRGRY